jgi:uncharacterized protein YecE (DUF72 family)
VRRSRETRARIGCAGWALDKALQPRFPSAGTHLERYAAIFPCVEINSSFYRPHKPGTYRRWAESVPPDFRFSAKVPKEITHTRKLRDFDAPLDRFLSEVRMLGGNLGPLLIQLPPSARFDPESAEPFLAGFRGRFEGLLALEPRHPTWFAPGPEAMLKAFRVARAAADPAVVPAAAEPGGWPGFVYRRLHGSPKIYYSGYGPDRLDAYAQAIASESAAPARGEAGSWCIFDNTAEGHAIPDALSLQARLVPESVLR